MKANLKNILGLAALGMTLLATTVATWAGTVNTPEVFIRNDAVRTYASGSMVAARYSADSTQFIGCLLYVELTDSLPDIRCIARDRAGNTAVCVNDGDPGYVREVQAMTDSSYISFSANRATGGCDSLSIFNYSYGLK